MTTNPRTRIGLLILIAVAAVSALAVGQGSPAPLGIVPTPTPTPLSVSIWTNKASYTIGESVTIYFSVNQAAYIYIYDIQPDGIVRLIFPNAYAPQNYVSAGTHTLPNGLYKFTVQPPTGQEQLQIFASPVQLGLAPMSYGEPFPMIGQSPGSAQGQIEAQIMGITPQPTWATAWTSFMIVPSYSYTPPTPTPPGYYPPTYSYPFPVPPFFGFPGGTWYWQDGQWHYGTPSTGWYWYFGPDGKWHFRIHIRIGN